MGDSVEEQGNDRENTSLVFLVRQGKKVSKKRNSRLLNEFTAGNTAENNPWLPMISADFILAEAKFK
jgi:hypothetical protein